MNSTSYAHCDFSLGKFILFYCTNSHAFFTPLDEFLTLRSFYNPLYTFNESQYFIVESEIRGDNINFVDRSRRDLHTFTYKEVEIIGGN